MGSTATCADSDIQEMDILDFSDFSDSPSPPPFSPLGISCLGSTSSSSSSSSASCSSSESSFPPSPCSSGNYATEESDPHPAGTDLPTGTHQPPCQPWSGFKIVGDNIDKNVRPRHQTLQCRTQSLHYFNSYAVLDRCDFSGLDSLQESASASIDLLEFDVMKLLPSQRDIEQLNSNLAILVGRMLTKHMPSFQKYTSLVQDHIRHKYSDEMSKMSAVVCQIPM